MNVKAFKRRIGPWLKNGLRSLVRLANYYHHFIQDYSKVARTFLNLLEKWLSQEWNEPYHQAFGELKSKFSSQNVIKFLGFHKHFDVHMEVRDFIIGGCWCKMDGHLHMGVRSSMIVRPCPTCERNGYPKSGMMFVTKSLGSLRPSSLRRLRSTSQSLTNLFRCIEGQVTLPFADVEAR